MFSLPDLVNRPASSPLQAETSRRRPDEGQAGDETFSALLAAERDDQPADGAALIFPALASVQIPVSQGELEPAAGDSAAPLVGAAGGSPVIAIAPAPSSEPSIKPGEVAVATSPGLAHALPSRSQGIPALDTAETAPADAVAESQDLSRGHASPVAGQPATGAGTGQGTALAVEHLAPASVQSDRGRGVTGSGRLSEPGRLNTSDVRASEAALPPLGAGREIVADQILTPALADGVLTVTKGGEQDAAPAAGLLVPQGASQPASASHMVQPATVSTQPPAIATATPSQLPEILSEALGNGDDRQERIVVQLDPPELGRVSLEFKFDAQGLQTVTVIGETNEAMRRLRLMHADLVQALEQHGLPGENLNFGHQQSHNHTRHRPTYDDTGLTSAALDPSPRLTELIPALTRSLDTTAGLDIKI